MKQDKAINRVRIYWEGPFLNLNLDSPALDATMGIYMFVDNDRGHNDKLIPRKVLYIGMTYYQTFRDEIQAKLRGALGKWLGQHKFDTTMKVAHVEAVDQERISEALVRDIENLLIMVIQPSGNIQSKESYSGRWPLRIINYGKYRPLPRMVSTDDL
jgi:hypothetical protein